MAISVIQGNEDNLLWWRWIECQGEAEVVIDFAIGLIGMVADLVRLLAEPNGPERFAGLRFDGYNT